MATMKKSEMDTLIRNSVIDTLGVATAGTQIDGSTYAIPVETPEGTFYAKVSITAAQRTATKVNPAFSLEDAVAKYEAKLAEREAKAAERAAAKAAKVSE